MSVCWQAWLGGKQGTVDSLEAEAPLCPVSLRSRPSLAREDLVQRRSRSGEAEDPGLREGPAAAGEVCRWPVELGQTGVDAAAGRRRVAGLDAAGGWCRCLDLETAGHEIPRSRNLEGARFLDLGTSGRRCLDLGSARVSGEEVARCGNRCLDLGRAEMARCGYEVPRSRKICLHLGRACPHKQTVI